MDTTLIKGLRVLERLIQADTALGVTALATELKLLKSNVHRTLATLVEAGYVVQDDSGDYRPTLRTWEQGMRVMARDPVRRAANVFMQALHHEISETVNLIVLDGDDCLCIHQIAAPVSIRTTSGAGTRAPAIFPASGKALLAYQPDSEKRVRAIYAKQRTSRPKPPRLNELLEEISAVRRVGCAVSLSGWREGINSVAGVIIGPHGIPAAAIAVSGPQERMTAERMQALTHSVLNTCTQAGSALGA